VPSGMSSWNIVAPSSWGWDLGRHGGAWPKSWLIGTLVGRDAGNIHKIGANGPLSHIGPDRAARRWNTGLVSRAGTARTAFPDCAEKLGIQTRKLITKWPRPSHGRRFPEQGQHGSVSGQRIRKDVRKCTAVARREFLVRVVAFVAVIRCSAVVLCRPCAPTHQDHRRAAANTDNRPQRRE
jgi:hypothetical protein